MGGGGVGGGRKHFGKSSFSEADNFFCECFRHGKKIRRRDVECGVSARSFISG